MCSYGAWAIDPAAAHEPVPGSYCSALARTFPPSFPQRTATRPFARGVAVCMMRLVAIAPVLVHAGSTSAGYATPRPLHVTRTVQMRAPGGVTARPHGGAGARSTAQPSTATSAGRSTPAASTTKGGAMRSRGAPTWSSSSSVRPTRRKPVTPSRASS